MHQIFCFISSTPLNNDLFIHWENWQPIYKLLDSFLLEFNDKMILSLQSIMIPLKQKNRVTFKNAPTGGNQKWSEKANFKICNKHSSNPDRVFQYIFVSANLKSKVESFDVYFNFTNQFPYPSIPNHDYFQDLNLYICDEWYNENKEKANIFVKELASLLPNCQVWQSQREWVIVTEKNGLLYHDVLMNKNFAIPTKYEIVETGLKWNKTI